MVADNAPHLEPFYGYLKGHSRMTKEQQRAVGSKIRNAAVRVMNIEHDAHLIIPEYEIINTDDFFLESLTIGRVEEYLKSAEKALGHYEERLNGHFKDVLAARISVERIKNEFARNNMRLITLWVNRFSYSYPNIRKSDMESNLNLVLGKAINEFDFEAGFNFSTYASKAMIKSAYNLKVKYRAMRKIDGVSIDYSRGGRNLKRFLGNDDKDPADQVLLSNDKESVYDDIQEALKILDEREREVIRSRMGFDENKTTRELAERFNCSHQTICNITEKALDKMRALLEDKGIEHYFRSL